MNEKFSIFLEKSECGLYTGAGYTRKNRVNQVTIEIRVRNNVFKNGEIEKKLKLFKILNTYNSYLLDEV